MPFAVTRSQLRLPAWRPGGGHAPPQLQRQPSAITPAAQQARGQGGLGCTEALAAARSGGEEGESSPAVRLEASTSSSAALQSGRAVFEREETPFFTPLAALPSFRFAPASSAAAASSLSRLAPCSGPFDTAVQDGNVPAASSARAQSQPLEPDASGPISGTELSPAADARAGKCNKSDAEGSSASEELQETASPSCGNARKSSLHQISSNMQSEAGHSGVDATSSSSGSAWPSDMADWGSPEALFCLSGRERSPHDSGNGERSVHSRQRAHEQACMSAASSMGECTGPDKDSVDQHIEPAICSSAVSCRALGRQQAIESQRDSCASAAVQSMQAPTPGEAIDEQSSALPASVLCSPTLAQLGSSQLQRCPSTVQSRVAGHSAHSLHAHTTVHLVSPAEVGTAEEHQLEGSQASNSPKEPQAKRDDSVHSSRSVSASRVGRWVCDSSFLEAPAGVLPGQTMQSPAVSHERSDVIPSKSSADHLDRSSQPSVPRLLPGQRQRRIFHACLIASSCIPMSVHPWQGSRSHRLLSHSEGCLVLQVQMLACLSYRARSRMTLQRGTACALLPGRLRRMQAMMTANHHCTHPSIYPRQHQSGFYSRN